MSSGELSGSGSEQGREIPGAVERVAQLGLTGEFGGGWFTTLRYRYVGSRPLVEDNSVRAASSQMVNLAAGLAAGHWRGQLELLNALDSDDHDIDYYYRSRLAGDPADSASEGLHFHPNEPRMLRLSLRYQY